ncbi:MAG: hypothetical protein ACE5OP_13695, partial [Candidatus Glassbacteria bacterium]
LDCPIESGNDSVGGRAMTAGLSGNGRKGCHHPARPDDPPSPCHHPARPDDPGVGDIAGTSLGCTLRLDRRIESGNDRRWLGNGR